MKLTLEKRLLRYREGGLGYKRIAKKTGLNRDQVREYLLNRGKTKRITPLRRANILKFRKHGLGYRLIARKVGLKRDQVRRLILNTNKKKKIKRKKR